MEDMAQRFPMNALEGLLKMCFLQKPELKEKIPTAEELTEYIQWMIREFADKPGYQVSQSAVLAPSFNLSNNKIASAGQRLINDPHDKQALREISELYRLHREDAFISDDHDICVGRMLRYMPSHWHSNDYFEVYYSLSGECPVYFTNETVAVRPGTVLIVAPSVLHASPCFGDDKVLLYYELRASTFEQIFWKLLPSQNLLSNFFHRALSDQQPNAYLQFDTGEDGDIRSLLEQIYGEFLEEADYQAEMMNSLMSTFFVLLLRRYEGTARLPRTDDFYWSYKYSGILSYIQSHSATVSLAELSERFHYSDVQLRRIVKSSTGMGFQQLITKLRMENAAALLRRPGASIAKVAAAVGYATVSSFYRAFTEFYGCTPGEYARPQPSG